jgi:hypothetical protein
LLLYRTSIIQDVCTKGVKDGVMKPASLCDLCSKTPADILFKFLLQIKGPEFVNKQN